MAILKSQTRDQVLLNDLIVADTYWTRMRGLIGTKSLKPEQGMWIAPGNWIHTFCMSFAIDCIFVDTNMKVVSILEDIKPTRLALPQWKASSVIELSAGQAKRLGFQLGEQLYVGN